jgi:hypothetical protein
MEVIVLKQLHKGSFHSTASSLTLASAVTPPTSYSNGRGCHITSPPLLLVVKFVCEEEEEEEMEEVVVF